jgi:hypothetical protein
MIIIKCMILKKIIQDPICPITINLSSILKYDQLV